MQPGFVTFPPCEAPGLGATQGPPMPCPGAPWESLWCAPSGLAAGAAERHVDARRETLGAERVGAVVHIGACELGELRDIRVHRGSLRALAVLDLGDRAGSAGVDGAAIARPPDVLRGSLLVVSRAGPARKGECHGAGGDRHGGELSELLTDFLHF